MRMSTIDVGMRLGDAIDPFQLANGFEAVIGYECHRGQKPKGMTEGPEGRFQTGIESGVWVY